MTVVTHVHSKETIHHEVRHIFYGWLFVLVLIVIWESFSFFIGRESLFFTLIVPPPSQIVCEMIDRWNVIYPHFMATFLRTVCSLLVALALAIPLGWAMAMNEMVSTVSQGIFLAIQSIPSFCLVPILIVWFGWGTMPVFIPALIAALLPLTINVFRGLKTEDPMLKEYFTVMKATSLQRFMKLSLPTIKPFLFSGLRIAIAGSGMASVAGEWAGATSGLGVLLLEMREQMDLALMFACVALISMISAFLYIVSFIFEMAVPIRMELTVTKLKLIVSQIKQRCFFAVVLFAMIGLNGCSSQHTENEKPSANELKTIKLMIDWTPCPTHIPLYHGVRSGIFEKEGIDLRIMRPGSGDPLQLVSASSSVDAVISHLPRTIRLYVKEGFNLKVIGVLVDRPLNGFLARKDKASKIEDLNNCRLGFSGSKFSSSTLDILLAQKGVKVKEKLNVRLDLLPQLIIGNVDAIWGAFSVIEPFQMKAFHVEPQFFGVEEFGMPSYPELIVVSSQNGVFSDISLMQRFQKALQQSLDDASENTERALQNYFIFHPEKNEKAKKWERESWKHLSHMLAKRQYIDRNTVSEPLTEWLYTNGIITQKKDLNPLLHEMENRVGIDTKE